MTTSQSEIVLTRSTLQVMVSPLSKISYLSLSRFIRNQVPLVSQSRPDQFKVGTKYDWITMLLLLRIHPKLDYIRNADSVIRLCNVQLGSKTSGPVQSLVIGHLSLE